VPFFKDGAKLAGQTYGSGAAEFLDPAHAFDYQFNKGPVFLAHQLQGRVGDNKIEANRQPAVHNHAGQGWPTGKKMTQPGNVWAEIQTFSGIRGIDKKKGLDKTGPANGPDKYPDRPPEYKCMHQKDELAQVSFHNFSLPFFLFYGEKGLV
jgi:hypothetical protein